MQNEKEHRIYKYMDEPFRCVGFTIDEMALFFVSLGFFFFLNAMTSKLIAIFIGTIGVYCLKRFKKMSIGFSLMSFLHWKFGIRIGLPSRWPESWKRYWLP